MKATGGFLIEKLKKSNKDANEFIIDIADLLKMETDGVGCDELQFTIDDFKDAIRETVEKYTHCCSCGEPLSRKCPRCERIWENPDNNNNEIQV